MILITGGTGLVGSHLLLQLAAEGMRVRATFRKSSGFENVKKVFRLDREEQEALRLFDKVEWVEADILDVPALEKAFEGITAVYHCAALVSFDPADNKKLRKINIEGTANVVNLCIAHQIKKLCFVSSIATFDLNPGQSAISEASHWNKELDHRMYAISKYGAEMEVWRASQEGIPVVIVNPGVIIGPGAWNTGSGLMFKKVWGGLRYTFPKTTGFVGVWDVAKVLRLLMDSPIENEQFLLVSENLSFRRVLELVAESLKKPAPSRRLKPWMVSLGWAGGLLFAPFGYKRKITRDSITGLFADSFYDSSKVMKELDLQFESMESVIARTGEAFRKEINR